MWTISRRYAYIYVNKFIYCSISVFIFFSIVVQFFVHSTQIANADAFYPNGNVGSCRFATAVGTQYNDIGGNGVSWDPSYVQGVSGNWIQTHTMLNVADIAYPNAHRYPNLADKVSVPPNTRVEFGLFVWNYTGHNVDVDNIHFYTSRSNPDLGDLTKLGAGGTYGSTTMTNFGTRSGKRVITGSLGTFQSRVAHGGRLFYSFETIQPMQVQSLIATPNWDGVNLTVQYDLQLKNISQYDLTDIRVYDQMPSGAVYDQLHNFNAGQTKTITYLESWGTDYPNVITNNSATIWDNNRHIETQSQIYPNVHNGSSSEMRPVVVMRDDSNAPAGWNAGQPTWGQIDRPPVIVELIPYKFDTPKVTLDLSPNILVQKTVSDGDEVNVKNNTANNRETIVYDITVTNTRGRIENI